MHVLFASAEVVPVVSTGGLGAATAGLTAALRRAGHRVELVVPDYGGYPLQNERCETIHLDPWIGAITVRTGTHAEVGPMHLVRFGGIERPHPYVDPDHARGWGDNDHRFFGFSAVVAELARRLGVDVVHLNDWHTAGALGRLPSSVPTVLTIHNLAHQGWADLGWLANLGGAAHAYAWNGAVNALAGGIRLADRVVAVSPTYADEVRRDDLGMGLAPLLRDRGPSLRGILNGIDTAEWDPSLDPTLVARFSSRDLDGKSAVHDALCDELGIDRGPGPLITIVSRFDDQKGIDLLTSALPYLGSMPARLAVLGSGAPWLERAVCDAAAAAPGRIAAVIGYDASLAHRLFAAGHLTVVPSRFEPCGLTQMQAMQYGTVPIVTDVGGLHDTVIDVDTNPRSGTGIVIPRPDAMAVLDGLHRGVRLATNKRRYASVQRRGMERDWSWDGPAEIYADLYREVAGMGRSGA
ncbi:MAG TPA: glycogen/starch synthase [Microthrixaceae bacterium]|nr:glycogen/starch synthase [Microthrixaceae bacterium]HMT24929.1 glycogen/starch synthase [Microthrixaceae bacterium]HMT60459.1 glycogen/starch synthase [Microthrixaceae bacterium]